MLEEMDFHWEHKKENNNKHYSFHTPRSESFSRVTFTGRVGDAQHLQLTPYEHGLIENECDIQIQILGEPSISTGGDRNWLGVSRSESDFSNNSICYYTADGKVNEYAAKF